MYELKDIKVRLLNPDEVKHFIRNHGYIACICYGTDERNAEKVDPNVNSSGQLSQRFFHLSHNKYKRCNRGFE